MARNLKLFNHWLSELRCIAMTKNLKVEIDVNEYRPITNVELKGIFDRSSMYESFKEGQTPEEALDNELDYWEPLN